jgi:hypothetical protein
LLETLKSRPALQSFEQIQKPKPREITEIPRRIPRQSQIKTDPKKRNSSTTKISEAAWNILDSLEFEEFNLNDTIGIYNSSK